MLIESKVDEFYRVYLEFNGSSHLYFINGYIDNGNDIDIFIGKKVLEQNFDILYKIIELCKNNFENVNLHTNFKLYKIK